MKTSVVESQEAEAALEPRLSLLVEHKQLHVQLSHQQTTRTTPVTLRIVQQMPRLLGVGHYKQLAEHAITASVCPTGKHG